MFLLLLDDAVWAVSARRFAIVALYTRFLFEKLPEFTARLIGSPWAKFSALLSPISRPDTSKNIYLLIIACCIRGCGAAFWLYTLWFSPSTPVLVIFELLAASLRWDAVGGRYRVVTPLLGRMELCLTDWPGWRLLTSIIAALFEVAVALADWRRLEAGFGMKCYRTMGYDGGKAA